MPNLELVDPKEQDECKLPSKLFTGYQKPKEILEGYNVFKHPIFNRYVIKADLLNQEMNDEKLVNHIIQEDTSALIILNTISDSKRIYTFLNERNSLNTEILFLLNTHFTLVDRQRIIKEVQDRLKQGQRVILVSTQLVEAGVDIDFPVVYRDLCPLPSVVQSAGRCNRNGAMNQGNLFLFRLQHEGQASAEWIYDKEDLNFVVKHVTTNIEERDLIELQKKFFDALSETKRIGIHKLKKQNENMVEVANKGEFDTLGYFRLIDEDTIGKQYTYYIPENESDDSLGKLKKCQEKCQEFISKKDFNGWRKAQIDLESLFKRISQRCVTFRISYRNETPQLGYSREVMGIRELSNPLKLYLKETGLQLDSTLNQIL
jgi:CRISPR-associated endonuclease/helicase Cas3